MSLSSALPAPINISYDPETDLQKALRGAPEMGALVSAKVAAPPYGQRKGWIPRTDADYGDGGAFPEITVVQYPLGKQIECLNSKKIKFKEHKLQRLQTFVLAHVCRDGRTTECW